MSCYHPNIVQLKANSKINKDGSEGYLKEKIIFANNDDFKGYEYYLKQNKKFDKDYAAKNNKGIRYKLIPCGKCIGCRATERKNWAIRLELESRKYEHNYFITLTYNDENLIYPEWTHYTKTDKDNKWISTTYIYTHKNNPQWKGTLSKEDMSRFMHNLRQWAQRKYEWEGIRFYGCGEYGSAERTERPHMHIILLNCPEIELKPIGKNQHTKHAYYTNDEIEHLWGKGFITIGEVNWNTISYTAGYTTKKLFGEVKKQYHASRGQEPLFANMSRRPGIGREYYNLKNLDIYDFDEIINSKGNAIKPPRYFDRLLEKENKEYAQAIKQIREWKNEEETKKKLSITGKSLKEQLLIDEETAKRKQQLYKRERIKA